MKYISKFSTYSEAFEYFIEQQNDWNTLPFFSRYNKVAKILDAETEVIWPQPENLFKALLVCPPRKTKVIILGQDPYHTPGMANGLAFSSFKKVPPSLVNIFKEILTDVNVECVSPDLRHWGRQGVLLLNTSLTVIEGKPGSHSNKFWNPLIEQVFEKLRERKNNVYMLWGEHAKQYLSEIDTENNLVLTASHPSPLSAHRGFFMCKHFSKCNEYLKKHRKVPIDWNTGIKSVKYT